MPDQEEGRAGDSLWQGVRVLAPKFGHQFLLLFLSLLVMLGAELGSLCPLYRHSVAELQGIPVSLWILLDS